MAVTERFVMRGGPFRGPPPEAEPLPLREAAAASIGSLRLAWQADRSGLVLLVALNTATTVAEVAQLLAGRSAVDGVVDGHGRGVQARRLLVLAGLGLVATAGRSVRGGVGGMVTQAAQRHVEGRILDVVATMELADVEDPAFQDRLQQALMGAQREAMLFGAALAVPEAVLGLAGALATMTPATARSCRWPSPAPCPAGTSCGASVIPRVSGGVATAPASCGSRG